MLDEREDGEVDPKDAHRAFNRQSLAKRSAIVVAGPAANFLLAIFLYGVLAMSGLQEPAPVLGAPPAGTPAAIAGISDGDRVLAIDGTTVASFTDLRLRMIDGIVEKRPIQLRVAGAGGERTVSIDTRSLAEGELERDFTRTLGMELRAGAVTVGSVVGGSSAAAAGIVAGDEILSIDQQPIRRASELIDRVRAAADKPLQFTVRRGETELQLPVTPRGETEVAASDAGGGRVGKIGAALQQRVEMVTVDLGTCGRGSARREEDVGHVDLLASHAGQDGDRRPVLEEPERPGCNRGLRRTVGEDRLVRLRGLPRVDQREPGRAELVARCRARWRSFGILRARSDQGPTSVGALHAGHPEGGACHGCLLDDCRAVQRPHSFAQLAMFQPGVLIK
jgi:membrane-associated protease RseP (regulator of RpoE activity)